MASVHVIVCLLGLVALGHSGCFFSALKVQDLKDHPKGCVDEDGKQHDFGSEWVRDCIKCSCTTESLSCCDMIPAPSTMYLPEECELVVNREDCSTNLVLKSDKTKTCHPV